MGELSFAARAARWSLLLALVLASASSAGCGSKNVSFGTGGGTSDAGGCTSDAQCASSTAGPVCDTASGTCGQCSTANDLCPTGQVCSGTPLACIAGCKNNADCAAGGAPLTCDPTTHECKGCMQDSDCPLGTLCAAGELCTPGCNATHGCASPDACCGSQCTNLGTDPDNCGSCQAPCSTNHVVKATCQDGVCNGACEPGYANCDDDEQSDGCESTVATDPNNCGGCGLVCSANHIVTPTCASGMCDGTCEAGWFDCDNNKQTNGCETTIQADPGNCGGCGVVCGSAGVVTPVCVGGVCASTCLPGFANCDNNLLNGCEVDTGTDPNNCGACGTVCSTANVAGVACTNGVCDGACLAGFADCDDDEQADGCETNVGTDPNNCGGCNIGCSTFGLATVSCGGGMCNGTCLPGFADCNGTKQIDGCETETGDDVLNCGGCGIVCSTYGMATVTCTAGVCSGTCAPGFTDCDNNKQTDGCEVMTATDPGHCGGCNVACSTNNITPSCSGGVCNGTCNTGFADCDDNKLTDGCETNILTNTSDCGGCGLVCSGNNIALPTCSGGVCNGACNAGFADCNGNKQPDGCETNISSNASDCGGCGLVCSGNNIASATCSGGVCNGACTAPWVDCTGNKQPNGCEVNPETNPDDCGGCGMACSTNHMASYTCTAGTCSGACAAGWADCNDNKLTDGCETGTATDPNNCGGCTVVCSSTNMATVTCGGGVCNGTCAAGYADCDNNKQKDGCETGTSIDPNNCGGCNVVCSVNNMATVTCAAGVCNGTCQSPFIDCTGNKQANGCEVNPETNPADCGGCGNACSTNNMATVTCGAGLCNGACNTGYADCDNNKLTNGCETNVETSAQNCGTCGNACATGESCVNGACQTCNTAVLLLGDGTTALDTAIGAALTAAGMVPTIVDTGVTTYTATPSATAFGAIVVDVGNDYGTDMPLTGQSAIVTAFDSGVGVVFTEWASYEQYQSRWATLKALLLATYESGTNMDPTTYTLTSTGHPIWTGLATTFTTTASVSEACGVIQNGGTRIATSSAVQGTLAANGIVVKDVTGASGRTVQIDHAGNYDPTWTSDANLMKMFTNSVRWAARCM